jgi:hypothetical protein
MTLKAKPAVVGEACRPSQPGWDGSLRDWLYQEIIGPFKPGDMQNDDDFNLLDARLRAVEEALAPEQSGTALKRLPNVKEPEAVAVVDWRPPANGTLSSDRPGTATSEDRSCTGSPLSHALIAAPFSEDCADDAADWRIGCNTSTRSAPCRVRRLTGPGATRERQVVSSRASQADGAPMVGAAPMLRQHPNSHLNQRRCYMADLLYLQRLEVPGGTERSRPEHAVGSIAQIHQPVSLED